MHGLKDFKYYSFNSGQSAPTAESLFYGKYAGTSDDAAPEDETTIGRDALLNSMLPVALFRSPPECEIERTHLVINENAREESACFFWRSSILPSTRHHACLQITDDHTPLIAVLKTRHLNATVALSTVP